MLANRLYFRIFPNSLNCKIAIYECWLIGSTPKLSSFHKDIGKWRFLNISLDCTFQFFWPPLLLSYEILPGYLPENYHQKNWFFWHLRKLNFKIWWWKFLSEFWVIQNSKSVSFNHVGWIFYHFKGRLNDNLRRLNDNGGDKLTPTISHFKKFLTIIPISKTNLSDPSNWVMITTCHFRRDVHTTAKAFTSVRNSMCKLNFWLNIFTSLLVFDQDACLFSCCY